MSRSPQSLVAIAVIAASGLFAAATNAAPRVGIGKAQVVPASSAPRHPVIAVRCGHPAMLRLIRFEDGSAVIRCGRRILIRVSVPG